MQSRYLQLLNYKRNGLVYKQPAYVQQDQLDSFIYANIPGNNEHEGVLPQDSHCLMLHNLSGEQTP